MTLSELLSKAEYYSLITDEEYKELKKQIQPCEDCISREEVLRHRHVVQNNDWIGCCVVRVDEITKLPSVTPSNDAIKEAYIKGYDYGVKDWFKSKTEPCEDCVSREEAIKILKSKMDGHTDTSYEWAETVRMAIKALEQQPNRCDSCIHSEEQDGSNCYECVKGMADNFEAQPTDVDCISREEVIKHLENITMDTNPDNYDNKDKWYQANGFNLCKVGIEMYVKNLPPVISKTRWIPVSERLPEEAGVYLVSMNRLGYPQREVDGFACGRWERFGNDVIAWCKIPEPYKEESEE